MKDYQSFLIESALDTISAQQQCIGLYEGQYKEEDEKEEKEEDEGEEEEEDEEDEKEKKSNKKEKKEVKESTYFVEMLNILVESGYLETKEDFLAFAEAAIELHDYYLTEGLTGERYHKARKMISDVKMPPGYKRNRRTYTNDEMQKINKLERLSGLGISNQGTTRDKMPHRGGKFGLDTGKGNKAKRRAGEDVPEYDYGDKD